MAAHTLARLRCGARPGWSVIGTRMIELVVVIGFLAIGYVIVVCMEG